MPNFALFVFYSSAFIWIGLTILRARLANRAQLLASLEAIVGWAVVVGFLETLAPPPANLYLSAVATIGFVIFGFILVRSKEETPTPPPVEVKVILPEAPATLSVEPLPTHKGYLLPPKVRTDVHEAEQYATIEQETTLYSTTPVFNDLAKSQWICGFQSNWPKDIGTHEAYLRKIKWEDYPWKELIVKFGVFRVQCQSGDAAGCRAEVRCKINEEFGTAFRTNWLDMGYLNWFSPDLRLDIQNHFSEIDANRTVGINKYLINPKEDIHQGESKDLLAFYMMKGIETVFVCTEAEAINVGMIHEGVSGRLRTLKFELEFKLTAERYRTTTWHYLITVADFDDYDIRRI